MNNLPYNSFSKKSIIDFAKEFIGKSIQSEFKEELKQLNLSNRDKGQLGKVIEQLYFQYSPNSDSNADFYDAGLELKSSGLKQLKNKEYRAKERLVLSVINYLKINDKSFEKDFLDGKNGHLLLIFYLYKKGLNQLSSEIKLVGDWKYPEEDIKIIKKDWVFIQKKILSGKAHELSEGDTFYLGACTKGGKGGNPRKQPNNDVLAKQRAYSLKSGYLNHIIASIAKEETAIYGKIIERPEILNDVKSIEDIVKSKFDYLIGKSDTELAKHFNLKYIKTNIKNYHSKISKEIVKAVFKVPKDVQKVEDYIEEFRKSDLIIKTVRLKENNLPEEDISFPNFKYQELIETDWEDSDFKNILESKFFFVFYQYEGDKLILRKVKFWNMTHSDILEAKNVWEEMVNTVSNGKIVKEITNKGIRKTYFPKKTENRISHVRPHAQNREDTYDLPVADLLTGLMAYTKHCFWFNASYVRDEIYLK